MKTNDNILTRGEIEQLCRLFLDGGLSVAEERELGVVLSVSEERGGIIDDVVFLLGIERICANSSSVEKTEEQSGTGVKFPRMRFAKSLIRILFVSSCAAVFIMAMTVGWNAMHTPESLSSGDLYSAYVNGKEVTDREEARRIAIQSYEASMAFIAEMNAIESEKMNEVRLMKGSYEAAMKKAASAGELEKTNQIHS